MTHSGFTARQRNQGKLFYFFPVRERSGNLKKMAQMWEQSGNFDWPVHPTCPQKQVIKVFFSWSGVIHADRDWYTSQHLKIWCQTTIIIIMEF